MMKNNKRNSVYNASVKFTTKETNFANSGPLEKKIIRNFTDLLILKHLRKYPLVSGYEILTSLRQKFDIPFSPGTIYSVVYSLERHGFIKGNGTEIGRAYELTVAGGKLIDAVKTQKRIRRLFTEIILEE